MRHRTIEDSFSCICIALAKLFTVSFNTGKLPGKWLTADVIPLYKKGSVNNPNNYRPVSLTCICCKVIETL